METKMSPGILIVEDDKLLSFVEERLVEKLGYKVTGKVESGEEAVRYVKEEEVDLIIMDIKLNGSISGVDAMEKIREFSSTPVIFLSGSSTEDTDERISRMENCVEYLVKPVNAEDLRAPLKSVFEESKEASNTQHKDKSLASRTG